MRKFELLEEGNKVWDQYLGSYSKKYKESQTAVEKKMKLLYLVFVYVLPYCELSFCHRDHCRVSNERFLIERSKSGLRYKKKAPGGLSNHVFFNMSGYWDDAKDVQIWYVESSPKQFLTVKYQISKHLRLLILLPTFSKQHIYMSKPALL